jgi:hypothetical protein
VATDPANALLAVGLSSGVAVAAALARSVPSAAAPAAHRNGTRADEGPADDDEEDARSAKSTKPWLQRLPWLRRGGGRRRPSSRRRRTWGGGCCWCGGCCRPAAVVCFVAALLTHVELLRYLHLVVVPGEQRLCAVW